MTMLTRSRRDLARAVAAAEVVPAGPGRRWAALGAEAGLTLAPLLVVPALGLAGTPSAFAWIVGGLGVLAVATVFVLDVLRTGQTAVRRQLGLRTTSVNELLPPSASALFGRRTSTADLRAGRDPLLIVPPVPEPAIEPATERPAWRPPAAPATGAWRLELDDGGEFPITGATLLGRDPGSSMDADHALLTIPDLSRSISRVHALVEPGDDCLWLTDAGTTNGTRAASPSASGGTVIERWLRPGERAAIRVGGTIHLGDRTLRVARSG